MNGEDGKNGAGAPLSLVPADTEEIPGMQLPPPDSGPEESPTDPSLDLEFNVIQVTPGARMLPGPGPKGRTVPYFHYGLFAVMTPQTAVVGADGKAKAILVPLPPSGQVKLSVLKQLANRIWREEGESNPGKPLIV